MQYAIETESNYNIQFIQHRPNLVHELKIFLFLVIIVCIILRAVNWPELHSPKQIFLDRIPA